MNTTMLLSKTLAIIARYASLAVNRPLSPNQRGRVHVNCIAPYVRPCVHACIRVRVSRYRGIPRFDISPVENWLGHTNIPRPDAHALRGAPRARFRESRDTGNRISHTPSKSAIGGSSARSAARRKWIQLLGILTRGVSRRYRVFKIPLHNFAQPRE